jgi:hypothetical protein
LRACRDEGYVAPSGADGATPEMALRFNRNSSIVAR